MNALLQIAGQVREGPVTGDAPPTGGHGNVPPTGLGRKQRGKSKVFSTLRFLP